MEPLRHIRTSTGARLLGNNEAIIALIPGWPQDLPTLEVL